MLSTVSSTNVTTKEVVSGQKRMHPVSSSDSEGEHDKETATVIEYQVPKKETKKKARKNKEAGSRSPSPMNVEKTVSTVQPPKTPTLTSSAEPKSPSLFDTPPTGARSLSREKPATKTNSGRRAASVSPVRSEKTKKLPYLPGDRICEVDPLHADTYITQRHRGLIKPLREMKIIDGKSVTNPKNFPDAPLVMTFVRHTKTGRTKAMWNMIDDARGAIPDLKLVEERHDSLDQLAPRCEGRVPIYVHPCLYRALKLTFPLDVGGIARDGRVTSELLSGNLAQSCGTLSSKDFRSVVADI